MERRRYGQQHRPFGTARPGDLHRALHRGDVAGHDHLPAAIVVCGFAHLAVRGLGDDRLRRLEIHAQQRRHRPRPHRHRRLHRPPAQLQQARRRRQVQRLGGAQRAIFAERMARHIVRLVRQPDPALAFQHAQRRQRIGHDRGLGILGQGQVTLGALGHQPGQMLPQRVVHFLQRFARGRAGGGQRRAHADRLAALSGK